MASPTLLIGLGGTGSRIVQSVYSLATKRQRESISFAVFDTDINELKGIAEKTPQIKTIQTSTKLTVGEYLDIDQHARDNWFPVNRILNRKALTEGAGQVRAISRLALNTTIRQGKMQPLHEAIEDLYRLNGESAMQALRVIVVSSLAGGTGSGLILPISMYIRNYLITRFQQNAAIMRGFCILPEVFYEVIHGQTERNNLKCNAYAALRELDAFLMKGDGSLPENYNLKFEAPRAGSDEIEEFDVMPLDFCFLFDAQNMDGKKLQNFDEYMEHAANCIYSQSIAPTSKRSNSSEDNTIRDLCKAGGRNRYCGAGSSMLVYPMEDMKEYLALHWARSNMSKEWLEIDKQFVAENRANNELRAKGYVTQSLDRKRHYVDVVNAGYTTRDPFKASIRNQCYMFDETGFIEIGSKWDAYIKGLSEYVKKNATSGQTAVDEKAEECQDCASSAAENKSSENAMIVYSNWYKSLLSFHGMALNRTEESGQTLAYSLFHDENDFTRDSQPHRMETYLKDEDGGIMHPNAVRFFLYSLHERLRQESRAAETRIKKIKDSWNEFDAAFDDETTERVETADEYIINKLRKVSIFKRGEARDAMENLTDYFSDYYETTQSYRAEYVYSAVISAALEHVEMLCDALQIFYTILEKCVDGIDTKLDYLSEKYEIGTGRATRYVCATKKCMDSMSKKIVYTGNSLELPSELTAGIFNKMKAFALMSEKPSSDSYFVSIFDAAIMDYWREQIMKNYGTQIDMDVLEALECEAEFENPEQCFDLNGKLLYAARVIGETAVLSKPFIESPMGVEPRTIGACSYNPRLGESDVSNRKTFIEKNLGNNGGVPDESIDKNMIIFYQAIYGLRANDLSKFAPAKKAETYNRVGGEYYKAYFELTSQLNPDTQRSPVITPHIDRWWHIISKLPDLDEGNQLMQERDIHEALFWGLISGVIDYKTISPAKKWYQLQIKGDAEDLIVSNETPCDNLFEVLDAVTICPAVVRKIVNYVNEKIEKDLNLKVPIGNALLCSSLEQFHLREFPKGVEKDAETPEDVRSIFEIPLYMKKSMPVSEYHEDQIIRMLKTFFDVINGYMKKYYNGDEADYEFGQLIYKQYQLFVKNLENVKQEWPGVYTDSIFSKIYNYTSSALEDVYMLKEAKQVLNEGKYMEEKAF